MTNYRHLFSSYFRTPGHLFFSPALRPYTGIQLYPIGKSHALIEERAAKMISERKYFYPSGARLLLDIALASGFRHVFHQKPRRLDVELNFPRPNGSATE
jgi:hypothetical protein